MNKTAIKNFAIWARRKLISDITYKAGLIGINEKNILQPLSISTDNVQFFDIGTGKATEISNHEIKQRNALISRIKEKESTSDYKTAFQFVIEEVAYTWFNRLVAIRFMEVNDYLPSRIRVLSSEIKEKSEPDMVTNPFDTDMDFSPYEKDRIVQLKEENKLDELFRMLFIKQCNKLNEVLPELFEETSDYTEFLLTISFTDKDGIVSHLVNDIEEDDFKEAVQIIGWLYQYYNTELKEEVFALLKKNVKITKERIPAATQLFTPDWIVRYMVENSLGRLWVEGHPNESLKSEWKYYLEEAEQEEKVKIELEKIKDEYKKLNPEDIKIIDPCMGSGHILVYAFDVLMQIYESQGYTQRDAAQAIIEYNIYGLDIDDRAYQLAYFAIMMKARKYDRRFFTRGISPKLYSIKESNNIKKTHLQYFGNSLTMIERNTAVQQMEYLLDVYCDAKEYGSILNIDDCDWDLLNQFANDYSIEGQLSLESVGSEKSQDRLKEIIAIAEAMAQKYDVVVTNPPYMGDNGMGNKLSSYVKQNYKDTKSDLSTVFMEKSMLQCKTYGFMSMINIPVWMSLSSCEQFRIRLISEHLLINMLHNGRGVFGSDFGSTAFVFLKTNIPNYNAHYRKLYLKQGAVDSIEQKERWFFEGIGKYYTKQSNFMDIPGYIFAYTISENTTKLFANEDFTGNHLTARQGIATADNDRFLRFWSEVNFNKIGLQCGDSDEAICSNMKWFPYNKGGEYRKWYGNRYYIINWENNGSELRAYKKSVIRNPDFYFKSGLTWTALTAGIFSMRYFEKGFIFDSMGPAAFVFNDESMFYMLGLYNSTVGIYFLRILCPNLKFDQKPLEKLPLKIKNERHIVSLVSDNVSISHIDWDSFETSWDFVRHPLVRPNYSASSMDKHEMVFIKNAYNEWEFECKVHFDQLKANEEELNRIFIEIYGLQDELTPEVEDKDVTVRKADLQRDIKSLISYAVGCMFGRYSLDVDGLAYAGGEWDDSKYTTFIPDKDNCIPITDEEYFKDDIVGLFTAFVKKVYGTETLEENLDFIAKALGNKGDTSREIIRNYFVKDFIKDHVKIYQKRPIYWLYDSGKQDGFKALIYMHCYNADTTGIVRVDYLHKMQKIYMSEIDRMKDMAENSTQAREIAQAEKRKEKLVKQLKETKEYDEKIAHIALSRIDIDLDDGVKVNYDKVQTGQDEKKLNILAKI